MALILMIRLYEILYHANNDKKHKMIVGIENFLKINFRH